MDILNLFELNSAVSSQVTRNVINEGLFIPRIYTTSFGNKSLRFSAPLLWNNFIKGHSEFKTGFLQSLENLENLEKHSNFTSVRGKNWELRKVREKSGNFIEVECKYVFLFERNNQ